MRATPFDAALDIYEACQIIAADMPGTLTYNLQQLAEHKLPLSLLPQWLYTVNMMRSDYINKLDCIATMINPYWDLYL